MRWRIETPGVNPSLAGRRAGPPQARRDSLGGSLDVRGERGVDMSEFQSVPQQGVPTLTEVVDWPGVSQPLGSIPAAAVPAALAPSTQMAAEPVMALPSEEQLIRRVLADLQRQIDLMLEYRLREALTPLLARAADSVIRDARGELASTLRDVVARAVAQEMAKHRSL